MDRRFAPNFCFLLLWVALANGALVQTGGQPHQLQEPSLKSSRSIKSNSRVKRSVNDGDGERLNSGEANGELLKLFSCQLPTKVAEKRDTNNNIDSIAERDGISGNLYPETAIHNLEQTSDKVESDMQYRRSKIPTRLENGALAEDTRDTRVDNKAVYNIGQEASLEIPLTTKIDQPRIEELTKRDVIPQEDRFPLINGGKEGSRLLSGDTVKSNSENQEGSSLINNVKTGSSKARLGDTTSTRKSTATRRNEVPLLGPGILRNSLDDASDEDFQVRDKSADLEIHADSSGVRVKAKPASLQVVSNPHGDVKTLPGETHSEGVVAERRTFTPVLPAEKRTHHHHHLGGLGPRPLAHLPFLRHHHHFHRRHRLPWLRHREHINYPDVFERMRFNSMPEGLSPFGGMGPPLAMAPPMASMMGSSPPMIGSPPLMMSEGPGMSLMGGGGMGGGGMGGGGMGGEGMGGGSMGGGGMSGPLIPQLLQRSPTMETNPANRFGVPQSPMEEMSPGGIPPMGRINPMGDMSPMVKLGSMGDMSAMGRMGPMSDMSPMSRMNTMGDASPMGRMGSMGEMAPMGGMGPMESMMGAMSPSSPFGQSEMGRKNALEFWGLPNQDQIKALMRGENVQKVLGSNRYGESLGGITPGGMNPGMGGASFNANGMGDNMMGTFGGSGNSMFRGMSGGMSNMMGMRRNMLYKKDSIDKTDAYKKSMKLKESSHHKTVPAVKSDHAVDGTTRSGQQKFEDGILKKAQSLVAGEKHVAKNEESELHREHRIRKSSKWEEKRSLDDKHSKKTSEKHQKVKNVKGSKKDVAVQRPPIIYHPPPEVFHRPDIVLHRPPVLFHRPPIVYHQAPVVVHRPAVVYRQSPIVFHQPFPMVNQPYYRAWDNFQMNPAYSHVGTHVAQAYNYLGTPPAVAGYRKGVVPHKPKAEGRNGKGDEEKEGKRTEIPKHKDEKKSDVDKNEVAQKKKKDVVVNRPPIIYHPPPEVYHRPEIVVHRAPLLIKRPPIIYHQPAVIVHRPPVVYHQPPLIFHQPAPTVNQPVLYSHDNFVVHPSFFATHHGSVVSDAGRLLGVPNTISVPDGIGFPFEPAGANPGLVPGGLGMPGGMGMPPIAPMGRRKRSLHHKRKKPKHENGKRKNAVMVKRPPIVYHPPPEVYHRPDIVVHRAPLVVHRSPIIYHQAPVIVHRPAVVYHQPPVLFHQPPPMVTQPTFTSHDMYSPHHSLTLVGSTPPTPTFSNVALVASKPSQKSSIKKNNKSNSEKKLHTEKVFRKDRVKLDSEKHSKKNKIRKHKSVEQEDGSKKGHISRTKEGKASKKNAVLVKRPSIVYHPPPEVYHRPDIVVHRAPLVIHRSPIIYHQAPVIVHRPAVVYHQPPVLFHQPPPVVNQPVLTAHDVYHETSSLTHSSSSLTPHGAYLGVPSEIMTHPATAYGKSKVPSQRKHHQKHRRDITKEKSSKKNTIVNEDKTEKASKKNAVLVKRPPIIYHPPPEVYHRPDIVVHRAPIVIHRAPLVYHQAPVIVHRPAVVYHQPAVIFHQPPPMVHQPMLTSHDTFTPHDTLVLGGSTTEKVGDFEGPPPEAFATRKGEVPKNVKGTSRNTIPKESKDEKNKPQLYTSKDKGEYPHQRSMESKGDKSKGKERHSQRRSHLRKLILSLQKDGNHAKKGLQVAADSPLVLQRPPLIMSRPAVVAPALGHSLVAPMAHPLIQRVIQPVPVYQPVVRQVPVPVIRPVPVPVVYHHHHWPMHFHHNHIQPVMMPPPHYTSYSYHPYSFGKSDVPHHKKDQSDVSESSQQKDTIHVHDFGVPAHGHVGHVNGNSHVVTHHGYVTRHADCPSHCGTCQPPSCPSDCDPHCVAIIHHQHHRPHHIFMNHQHHHNIAQTHFHDHHWPVHHHDVYHNHPYFPHRHIGHLLHTYPPYHHHGRRDTDSDESSGHDRKQKTTVPHYKVYQHVKHWHPPCIHNSHTCHHHHHPMTIYHDHHHPTTVLHHHHFTPYPVYHHHEHIKPVIFHHLRPYPIHHHHEHLIHDTWHHDHHHHHVLPPTPYPVPVSIPTPVEVQVPVSSPLPIPVPIPQQSWMPQPPLSPCSHVACAHHVFGRSHVPYNVPMETKKSETGVPDKGKKKSEISKTKNKKKDVVVNRPPIIYHPPPEVYHRPEIVVHRAPVLVHRPPIVYHQPAVIVHRPPVVYHQSPVIFHQPAPTVNQPVLYSHDNFVVHPTMLASHAGTMVESAGHFLGVPSGSITNFPGPLSPYGAPEGFGTTPYATPFGRKRRSTKESPKYQNESTQNENEDTQKRDKNAGKDKNSEKSHNSRKANRKNAIVVHRPPVVYHPPPEIYHRPRVIVHRPDVLIHRPPIVYHQSPVVLHRPPVVYHQAPLVFHQPPPMINQPVYHSHDAYAPHPVFTHYNSDIHHVGAYLGVPPYAEEYHGGGYHGFGGFHGFIGGSSGLHGGFGGYPGLYGGIGGIHGGFGGFHGPFAPGFGRSEIEKPNHKKNKEHNKKAKGHKKSSAKSEKAHRKHSVMVHRPPVIFHPPPEIYHRPAYVIHQPDIVIHRPATVYHQSPVVVHHPPIAYHQHPVVYHQPPPIIVQPTYHHHQFFQECHVHGCYGGGPRLYGGHGGCFGHGCGPHLFGGFGGCFGHGCGFGGGFHGGYPFLYGKSNVPNDNHSNKDTKTPAKHKALSDDSEESKKHHKHTDGNTEHKTSNAKASNHEAVKETKGSKKNDIVIHRPPLVYHPPPEIYHRPDVVVHRPDVLVHRPSVVYDQPAVVLHRPAVVYHEPDVVFHQPPPLVNLPVYHASDIYAPHPVYEHTDSQVDYSNNVVGVPPHFSFGPYGVSHAFGKSRIEGSDDKAEKDSGDEKKAKKDENDPGSVKENDNSERDPGIETAKETHSERSEIVKESSRKRHHSGKHASRHTKEKSRTTKAHKKYHLIMHRPPLIYHSSPTIYHRPDVVVHHPDIVIHRPSVVVQPPSVVIHKPAVVYHQPPVVFHQPEPAIHQPVYHSHDSYEAHPVYTHVGSHLDHGGEYLAYPGMEYPNYGYDALPGFGKSKIQETEEKHTKENDKERHDKPERGNDKHVEKKQHEKEQHKDEEQEKKQHKHAKRDTQSTKTKRVQLPHAQKERTETGTKKNAIVVKRPPIIYHPPPEVYHRPDIVVHRAPIVIQRAPLVYHQSPVIVHRPAVVYHQPAVVFHQPAPAVHQPVFHSVDTFSVHPHLSFTQAGSSVHQTGQYVGIPQEVMHRSTVPTTSDLSNAEHTDSNPRSSVPAGSHPKQRRATIVHDVAPITPLNFIHPRHPRFETPRSTIPYPTLHPFSLSYASFPWGYSPKTKRSVEGNPYAHPEIATMVPHELYPLPYSPFYHPTPLQRPHVNVNIETVKSNVPKRKNRERRQSIFGPSQLQEPYPMQPGIDELHPGQMMPYPGIGPYPNLPRPHVNVNVETIKSAVPRDKRQVLAGLPAQEIPPSLAPQTYSQAVVPAQLPTSPELGVYRDLLGAIYPRGAHRRPKVNIVVQTAKSSIPTPQNLKKSVLPSSLNKGNVDAFNTMPEVTTIEPPLLRDGVRVNMVDLGDPTAGSNSVHPANFAPKLQPSFGSTNMQSYGTNILGLGAQGNFGMDKWKKSAITKPSTLWHDVNAQKKSSVPSVHREAGGKKRFMIDGFNSPGQFPGFQSGLEPQGSIPLAQPTSGGFASRASYLAEPEGSIAQLAATAGFNSPAGYAAEPQGYPPQSSGATEQGQPEPANSESQVSGIQQPGRPNVNVNVDTFKKHTLGSNGLPSKRQLIGTLPLTSLFRPNPNTAKASLRSMVPNRNPQPVKNSAQPVTKRQQIMRRVPLAQAIPQLRNRVTTRRGSPASATRGYAAYPVQDTQPQIPRSNPYLGLQTVSRQPVSRQQVFTAPVTSPISPPISESFVNPSPLLPPASPYIRPTIYPWGGRRPHVNINVQTTKSNIPAKSERTSTPSKPNKIITPRFKREFPVLYNIIKAKAKLDSAKRDGRTRRDKRQIPMFPGGGFLQSLIPDPNLLAKRAFYGSVPRYPINPAVLIPRASQPRPQRQPMGTIEVGGSNAESPVPNAANLLRNEFSQSFADIAKIQRQEVNAIKGMNMASQAPSPSVLNMPEQATPSAQVVSLPSQGSAPGLVSGPAATASAMPVQEQAQQPQVVPVSAQQTMATFAAAPQTLPARGQSLPAQFSRLAPLEIAPGFVRGKPEPLMQGQAVQASEPTLEAAAPADQAPEPSIGASQPAVSKKSPFTVIAPGQLPPGFQPQFPVPVQFPFFPAAELPPQPAFAPPEEIPQALPYPRPFFNPIPQPEADDSDRPSVNIQVQTSKSKIPKLQGKKEDTKDDKKKPH